MRIIDVAKTGDHILYVPTRASFSVTGDESGSKTNQYFSPNSLISWRVLKNDRENLEIIPGSVTPKLMLSGANGYMNCIPILNSLANAFVNPLFAESARNAGSKGAKPKMITDSYFTNVEHVIKNIDELQSFDAFSDCCIEEDVKILTENSLIHIGNFGVWLAARGINCTDRSTGFGVYLIDSTEKKDIMPLYFSFANRQKNYAAFSASPICPIVKLKKDVLVKSGDGTNSKPYVLEI